MLSSSMEPYEISSEAWGIVVASLRTVLVLVDVDSTGIDRPGTLNGISPFSIALMTR